MKSIGFVDYYLSEWHANNYPAWIEESCQKQGLDYKLVYAWAELDISPVDGVTTEQWCARFDAQKCDTLEELCEKSDVIVILAPSNPETHLRYAQTVLKYGKRTYIDKTFAPDFATALEIFDIAERYNTPFFSTSALRYADELSAVDTPCSMIVTGGGSNLPEYAIHLAEMVVKKMGVGIENVTAEKRGDQYFFTVSYADGRIATIIYAPKLPYNIYMSSLDKQEWRAVKSPFFQGLILDMLNFFQTGEASFDAAQTKEVARLREMMLTSSAKY